MIKKRAKLPSHPDLANRFVAWVDLMGATQTTENSPEVGRFRVFQFHVLVMSTGSKHPDVRMITAGDGVFLVSKEFSALAEFLRALYESIIPVNQNLERKGREECSIMIRTGIAYGEVLLGEGIRDKIAKEIDVNDSYLANLLTGPAASVAYRIERAAPPFGIRLDLSAINNASGTSSAFYRWFEDPSGPFELVCKYFETQRLHSHEFALSRERIDQFLDQADEYFHRSLYDDRASIKGND